MSQTRPLEKKSSAGETLLHSAIREAKSVEEIETFINKHKKSMHKMAQIVNNKGELPLFMIYSTPFTHQEQVKLQTLLIKYTLPDSYITFASGNYEAAKILLQAKANPNHSRFYDNGHPLLFSKNNKKIENLLVEHKAILNILNYK